LTLKLLTGNEALALGALRAGVKVATGYPGTPSTGCIESLLLLDPPGVHVEWSANEKVAFEIASGAAWAGQRALCTMKMSGVNVAYDSITSVAYSGVVGGMVIYVADDPGVSAGMCEQDTRGFAVMSDLPLLDAASVEDAYRLVQAGFEISERTGTPVFVRLVTSISSSFAAVDVDEDYLPDETRPAQLIRDIDRFTKAGSLICMAQHRDVIRRLGLAGELAREMGLNKLALSSERGGLGIVACGVVAAYLDEAFEIAAKHGFFKEDVSLLTLAAVHPFPAAEARELLAHCATVLVLEELEPTIEHGFYVEAQKMGWQGRILGKEAGGPAGGIAGGLYERVGEYGLRHIFAGLNAALPDLALPPDLVSGHVGADKLAAARPITVCAGCPHRGVFMAINTAVRKAGYKKDDVMVTGDIGCTILGMNPPFNTVWNEVSMGASIPLAQGYVYAGVKTPVIATIGDSTFFHAGMAGLVNAVQHRTPIVLVILDNGWTSMTGMQVNPGTDGARQYGGGRTVDIARIVEAMGVDFFAEVDPFDQDQTAAAILNALKRDGVRVILARQECAMPARRRGARAGQVRVITENCNACKLCIIQTGCPAISLGDGTVLIDPDVCYGCDLCGAVCNRDAIEFLPQGEAA
jgi:indolepyruvate ferredoxin oxidoreductase alpha subunit